MKLNYNFEAHEPPRITEAQLQETLKQRRLLKETLLLLSASLLVHLSLLLLAFLVAPYSLAAATACILLFGGSLAGSGVLAVFTGRKLSGNLLHGTPVGEF